MQVDIRNGGLIPGSGRSPGKGYGNPLQYSRHENPMDRGAWRATVHGATKSSDTTDLAGTPWNLFPLILSASAPNRANGSVCGQTAISALLGWDQLRAPAQRLYGGPSAQQVLAQARRPQSNQPRRRLRASPVENVRVSRG